MNHCYLKNLLKINLRRLTINHIRNSFSSDLYTVPNEGANLNFLLLLRGEGNRVFELVQKSFITIIRLNTYYKMEREKDFKYYIISVDMAVFKGLSQVTDYERVDNIFKNLMFLYCITFILYNKAFFFFCFGEVNS